MLSDPSLEAWSLPLFQQCTGIQQSQRTIELVHCCVSSHICRHDCVMSVMSVVSTVAIVREYAEYEYDVASLT